MAESDAAVVVVSLVVADGVWLPSLWVGVLVWASGDDDCVADELGSLFDEPGSLFEFAPVAVADWSTGVEPSTDAVAVEPGAAVVEPDASVDPVPTDESAGSEAAGCGAEASAGAVWSVDTALDEVVAVALPG